MPLQTPAGLHVGLSHPLPPGHELEWFSSQAHSGQGKGRVNGEWVGKGKAQAAQADTRPRPRPNARADTRPSEAFGAVFVSGEGVVSRHLKSPPHMATEQTREHLPPVAVRPDRWQPLPGAGRGRTLEAEAPNANFWAPLQEDEMEWEGRQEEEEWERRRQDEEDVQILCDLARWNASPCGSPEQNSFSLHGSRGAWALVEGA